MWSFKVFVPSCFVPSALSFHVGYRERSWSVYKRTEFCCLTFTLFVQHSLSDYQEVISIVLVCCHQRQACDTSWYFAHGLFLNNALQSKLALSVLSFWLLFSILDFCTQKPVEGVWHFYFIIHQQQIWTPVCDSSVCLVLIKLLFNFDLWAPYRPALADRGVPVIYHIY